MADPGYIENMKASHTEQWLKVLNEAQTKTNPYLASIAKLPDLDDQLKKEKAELERLKNADALLLTSFSVSSARNGERVPIFVPLRKL